MVLKAMERYKRVVDSKDTASEQDTASCRGDDGRPHGSVVVGQDDCSPTKKWPSRCGGHIDLERPGSNEIAITSVGILIPMLDDRTTGDVHGHPLSGHQGSSSVVFPKRIRA